MKIPTLYYVMALSIITIQAMEKHKPTEKAPLHPRLRAYQKLVLEPGNFMAPPVIQIISPTIESGIDQAKRFNQSFTNIERIKKNLKNKIVESDMAFLPGQSSKIWKAFFLIPPHYAFATKKPIGMITTLPTPCFEAPDKYHETWWHGYATYSVEANPIYLLVGLVEHKVIRTTDVIDIASEPQVRENDQVLKQTIAHVANKRKLPVPFSPELKRMILEQYEYYTCSKKTPSVRLRQAIKIALRNQREVILKRYES